MNEQQWKQKLEKEGYKQITTCNNPANTDFGEHTHEQHTVHVIIEGELIMTEKGHVKILKAGERFEIKAGTTHEAKCGPKGCMMIVGTKK